jgi:hypothetical protein
MPNVVFILVDDMGYGDFGAFNPAAAARWSRQHDDVRAVFIHEPDVDEILASMVARSGKLTPRKKASSKFCWLFGNWVREQALAERLPVIDASPRATLPERVLEAVHSD